MSKIKRNNAEIRSYLFIIVGSILYGLGTVMFIFPANVLLGGTSGIAIIISRILPLTAGNVSVILNVCLIVVAFLVLGKAMAIKTFVGSALTTLFIGVFDIILRPLPFVTENVCASAVIGASVIAVASGIMFYVGSSSGGTDILALILKKYVNVNIGRALLITDILIVATGGVISGTVLLFRSCLGFLIKVLGIDIVISCIKRAEARMRGRGLKSAD